MIRCSLRRYLRRKLAIKHALDKCTAALLLLLFWPLLLLVALLIKLDGILHPENAGPVFYREPRVSQGRVFRIIKFRTVPQSIIAWVREKPESRTISQHPQQTWAGNLILRWYLDEIPQLVNIARGEMSFVGPRPQLVATYERLCLEGLPSQAILRGGLLGIPQACKTIQSFQTEFKKMGKTCQIDQKGWSTLDVLYFDKLQHESLWGMFFFDFSLIVKGLRTVVAGARS